MSGGAWVGVLFLVVLLGLILFTIARSVWLFIVQNEEPVSGGSWGRQIFGRRHRR